jgi:hypothetical protein
MVQHLSNVAALGLVALAMNMQPSDTYNLDSKGSTSPKLKVQEF